MPSRWGRRSVVAWRPSLKFDVFGLIDVIMSKAGIRQRLGWTVFASCTHSPSPQSLLATDVGDPKFAEAIRPLWRRAGEGPQRPPTITLVFFLQSNRTALGQKCRPICVGTMRHLLAVATVRERWPRLTEVAVS